MSSSYTETRGETLKEEKERVIPSTADLYSKVNHSKSIILTFNQKVDRMGTLFATGNISFLNELSYHSNKVSFRDSTSDSKFYYIKNYICFVT